MKAIMGPTPQEIQQAIRDWQEAIQPVMRQATAILGRASTKVVVFADRRLPEVEYILSSEDQKALAACRNMMEAMKPAILKNLQQQ